MTVEYHRSFFPAMDKTLSLQMYEGHDQYDTFVKLLTMYNDEFKIDPPHDPVQAFIDEHFLYEKGLCNYWGYNTSSFFAPHTPYLSGNDVCEFRRMVTRICWTYCSGTPPSSSRDAASRRRS